MQYEHEFDRRLGDRSRSRPAHHGSLREAGSDSRSTHSQHQYRYRSPIARNYLAVPPRHLPRRCLVGRREHAYRRCHSQERPPHLDRRSHRRHARLRPQERRILSHDRTCRGWKGCRRRRNGTGQRPPHLCVTGKWLLDSGWFARPQRAVTVTAVTELADATVTQSHTKPGAPPGKELRALSPKRVIETYSAGVKLARVARGEADIYLNTYDACHDWDIAAGHLLVRRGRRPSREHVGTALPIWPARRLAASWSGGEQRQAAAEGPGRGTAGTRWNAASSLWILVGCHSRRLGSPLELPPISLEPVPHNDCQRRVHATRARSTLLPTAFDLSVANFLPWPCRGFPADLPDCRTPLAASLGCF